MTNHSFTINTPASAILRVKNQGYQAARDAIAGIRLIHREQNTLTIGKGTAVQSTINRTPGGRITFSNTAAKDIPLLPDGHPDGPPDGHPAESRFDAIIAAMIRRAKDAVLRDLVLQLRISPDPGDDTPDGPQQLPANPRVKRQAAKTARKAVEDHLPTTLPGEPPVQAAYRALHDFIGKEDLQQALRTTGQATTLGHLATFLEFRESLTRAAEQEPNAAILWAREQSLSDRAERPPEPSPEVPVIPEVPIALEALAILEKASSHTSTDSRATQDELISVLGSPGQKDDTQSPLRKTGRLIAKAIGRDNKNPGLREMRETRDIRETWQTFRNIDTGALGASEYSPPHEIALICRHIIKAGVQPSPQATRHLLEHPHLSTGGSNLITLYIRNSSQLEPGQQERLKFQLEAIRRYSQEYSPEQKPGQYNPRPLRRALNQQGRRTPGNWCNLLKLTPPWVRKAQGTPDDFKCLPTPKYAPEHIRHARVQGTPGDHLRLMTEEELVLQATPGRRAAVFTPEPERPLLLVRKEEDGTIRMDNQTAAALHPLRPGTPEPVLPPLDNPDFTYSHQGLQNIWKNSKQSQANAYAKEHWDIFTGCPNPGTPPGLRTQSLVNTAEQTATRHPAPPVSMANAITRTVASMLEEKTWQRAHPTGKRRDLASTFRYNAAATLGEKMDQLTRTNPGAVVWALEKCSSTDRTNHPGQIITMAKESLTEAGLDPTHWKFAATLDPELMQTLTGYHDPKAAATILNKLAKANTRPSPRVAAYLRFALPSTGTTYRNPTEQFRKRNTDIFIRLLARESEAMREPGQQDEHQNRLIEKARDVADYIGYASYHQTEIHSTAWKGLVRQSDAWHERTSRISAEQRWQATISRNNGRYLAWESALDTLEMDGYTLAPLDDEKKLNEESGRMDHCIYRYGQACAQGTSRIFSISKDNKPVATAQLSLRDEEWQPVQTRSKGNHQAPQPVINLMATVALLYNQAHQQKGERNPNSWLVDDPADNPRKPNI